jgi:hypothetical protein
MIKRSKIDETLQVLGEIDFNIRWLETKLENDNFNQLRNVEHQRDIAHRTIARLTERYNKQIEKLKIH